jgi:hypothetical protein
MLFVSVERGLSCGGANPMLHKAGLEPIHMGRCVFVFRQ